MPPCPALTNQVNQRRADAIAGRDCCRRFVRIKGSDCADLVSRELGVPRAFASRNEQAAFHQRILRVVLLRAEEQMSWVAARRIVAAMQDQEIASDRSVRHFPHQPMSQRFAPIDLQRSVGPWAWQHAPSPAPAGIFSGGANDIRHQPLAGRPFSDNARAAFRAEALLRPIGRCVERLAVGAGKATIRPRHNDLPSRDVVRALPVRPTPARPAEYSRSAPEVRA